MSVLGQDDSPAKKQRREESRHNLPPEIRAVSPIYAWHRAHPGTLFYASRLRCGLPGFAVGNRHSEKWFDSFRFFHLPDLLSLVRVVVPPEPDQRFGEIECALRDRVGTDAEAEVKIVAAK